MDWWAQVQGDSSKLASSQHWPYSTREPAGFFHRRQFPWVAALPPTQLCHTQLGAKQEQVMKPLQAGLHFLVACKCLSRAALL